MKLFESKQKKQKPIRVHSLKQFEHKFTKVTCISEYLDSIDKFGDHIMYVWKEASLQHEIKYSDFVLLVRQLMHGFADSFGTSGKRIAVIGETSPYWVAAYLAIIASGNTVVPMDKELDPEQISKFFELADVSAVVFSKNFNKVFSGMISGHKTLTRLIPIDCDGLKESKKIISFSHLATLGKNSTRTIEPDTDTERCCELLFTSGTTGTSKCVMLCQRNIFSAITTACGSVDFSGDDVLVSVLPLHHTYELTCSLAGFNYGMTICINDSLRHVLRSFKEYRPTAIVLVPLFVTTMYKKIMSEAAKSGKGQILNVASRVGHYFSLAGIDLSEHLFKDVREAFGGRLNKTVCGGAALDPKMVEMFDTFGIAIYEGYGITECSPLVAVTPYYKRKPGSVGPAVDCCTVMIDAAKTDEDGHEIGEILVKGDNVMLGYMNNDEANREAFTIDGWFRTGDMGYMDEDGYIFITGRKKSVIVLENGKNVFPEEIEEYLSKIEEIAESVVVGRDEDGCKLTAIIFPNYAKFSDKSENELRTTIQKEVTQLNKRLPSFKQIHRLEFRKTEFEKTTTKKIKRHLVK